MKFLLACSLLLALAMPVSAQCVSQQQVLEQHQSELTIDMKGDDLARFNARYKEKYGDPPDVDEVMLFTSSDPDQLVLITYKDGCVHGFQSVNREEFMKIYNGTDA